MTASGEDGEGDEERVRILRRFQVLDTLPEADFDEIVRLASDICEVPIALMSLVDKDRQWFKASVGLDVKETPRSVAFCSHAILQEDLFEITDAMVDARFSENPLVTGEPHIRFYAGVPLRSVEGAALGTICVLDRTPRVLTAFQERALRVLGKRIQVQLELGRNLQELARRERELQAKHDLNLILQRRSNELRSFLVHDLKNALSIIVPNADYVLESARLSEEERSALSDLREGAARMKNMVHDLLRNPAHHSDFDLRMAEFSIRDLVGELERGLRRKVTIAGQRFVVESSTSPDLMRGEPDLIRRVLENLVVNAIKYGCCHEGTITLTVRSLSKETVAFAVTDEGRGVPLDDRERIFERDTRLEPRHSVPDSFGLGLTFCKAIVEAHGGKICVETNHPHGAAFVIQLPIGGRSDDSSAPR